MHLSVLARTERLFGGLIILACTLGASFGVVVDAEILLDEQTMVPYFSSDPNWKPLATIADPSGSASGGAIITTGYQTEPGTTQQLLSVRQVFLNDWSTGWEYTSSISFGMSNSRPIGVARRDEDGSVFVVAMIEFADRWESIRCRDQPNNIGYHCLYVAKLSGQDGSVEWVQPLPYGSFTGFGLTNAVHYDAGLDRIFVHFDGFAWADELFYPITLLLDPSDGSIESAWPIGVPEVIYPHASTIHGDHLILSGFTVEGFYGEEVRCRAGIDYCNNCYLVKMSKFGTDRAEWTNIFRPTKTGNIMECNVRAQAVDPVTGDIVVTGNVIIMERASSEAFVAVFSSEDGAMKGLVTISNPYDNSLSSGLSVFAKDERILVSGFIESTDSLTIVDASETSTGFPLDGEQFPCTTFLMEFRGALQVLWDVKLTGLPEAPADSWYSDLILIPERGQLLWIGPHGNDGSTLEFMGMLEAPTFGDLTVLTPVNPGDPPPVPESPPLPVAEVQSTTAVVASTPTTTQPTATPERIATNGTSDVHHGKVKTVLVVHPVPTQTGGGNAGGGGSNTTVTPGSPFALSETKILLYIASATSIMALLVGLAIVVHRHRRQRSQEAGRGNPNVLAMQSTDGLTVNNRMSPSQQPPNMYVAQQSGQPFIFQSGRNLQQHHPMAYQMQPMYTAPPQASAMNGMGTGNNMGMMNGMGMAMGGGMPISAMNYSPEMANANMYAAGMNGGDAIGGQPYGAPYYGNNM